MERKIKQLFTDQQPIKKQKSEAISLSPQDWQELITRLDQTEAQTSACNEKIDYTYLKIMNWLKQVKEKIDTISETQKQLEENHSRETRGKDALTTAEMN